MVKQELIWNKSSFVLGRQDYQWKHESVLYGWKDGGAHYFANTYTETTVMDEEQDEEHDIDKMTKQQLKEFVNDLLEQIPQSVINVDKPQRNGEHPTMKPIKLFAKLIANSSRRDDIVFDPFAGSGTTVIAAEQLKRRAYVMELDPVYADVIVRRWENMTGEKAKLC